MKALPMAASSGPPFGFYLVVIIGGAQNFPAEGIISDFSGTG
jgi:hypothetical protein